VGSTPTPMFMSRRRLMAMVACWGSKRFPEWTPVDVPGILGAMKRMFWKVYGLASRALMRPSDLTLGSIARGLEGERLDELSASPSYAPLVISPRRSTKPPRRNSWHELAASSQGD